MGISHPVRGGDRSFVFALAPAALFELLSEFDPRVPERTDRPFLTGCTFAQTRQRILLYWLMQTARRNRLDDRLLIEEQAFKLLASVLADAVSLNRVTHRPTRTTLAHAELVHQAKLVLGARFKEKLSLAEIARAVHSSIYHLCRIFRQETHLTPHRYVVRLRLLGIVEYLVEAAHAELTATALDFGFDSLSHFSFAFRREFGFMPSPLRHPITPPLLREMSKILKA
jgi:AraC-like DNA-binding protein